MIKTFDRSITIQKINEQTEQWEDVYKVHACINKSKTDNEYLNAGAIQAKRNLIFEIRYFSMLEEISYNLQTFRIMYSDVPFNIEDYDDYMLMHKTVKLLGTSY